jgi:hypothetical protein
MSRLKLWTSVAPEHLWRAEGGEEQLQMLGNLLSSDRGLYQWLEGKPGKDVQDVEDPIALSKSMQN